MRQDFLSFYPFLPNRFISLKTIFVPIHQFVEVVRCSSIFQSQLQLDVDSSHSPFQQGLTPEPNNGLRYRRLGGLRERDFDGTNFKPKKRLKTRRLPDVGCTPCWALSTLDFHY
jgi:hypothetical protein